MNGMENTIRGDGHRTDQRQTLEFAASIRKVNTVNSFASESVRSEMEEMVLRSATLERQQSENDSHELLSVCHDYGMCGVDAGITSRCLDTNVSYQAFESKGSMHYICRELIC